MGDVEVVVPSKVVNPQFVIVDGLHVPRALKP